MNDTLKKKLAAWHDKDYRITFYERIVYLDESEPIFDGLPYALRYAKTFDYIVSRISTPVDDSALAGAVRERIPTPEEWRHADEITAKWWNIPQEEIQKEAIFYYTPAWLRRRNPWFMALGHLALQWEDLVASGLDFFTRRADACEVGFLKAGDREKADFARAAGIISRALTRYALRYADACEAAGQADAALRLRHVAQNAPRTLHEAFQLLWLVILPFMKVAGCGVFNMSHMDQYLLPLYEADIAAGRLTPDSALELIEAFYYRLHEFMATVDHMSIDDAKTQYTIELTFDDPHYLILGGYAQKGRGGVTPLSFLFLKAAHDMRLRNPFIVVRWYPGIDEAFWTEAVSAMRDNATVVLYNDETMLPALRHYGVREEDLYGYGFFGCNDLSIPHKEGGLRQTWFNFLRPLELALNGGDYPLLPRSHPDAPRRDCQYPLIDRLQGIQYGPYYGCDTPPVEEMRSMDDVIDAFRRQVFYLMAEFRKGFERDAALEKEFARSKFRIEDAFIEGPVERGVTWIIGGTRYHHVLVQGGGTATCANALYNLDQLVFRQKKYTLRQIVDALGSDYESDPALLSTLRRMKKFGNDEEEVDRFARLVADIFCDAVDAANRGDFLYRFLPTLSTDRDHTTQGREVGATPDGRKAREPISENQSPDEGTDTEGLTALLNSVARIDFTRIVGGPLNIRIHPSAVKGQRGLEALKSAFATYFKNGGMQCQLNVVGRETLLDAQKNPDRYKDLLVRVTGYSAYFTQMGQAAQSEMIRRSEKK